MGMSSVALSTHLPGDGCVGGLIAVFVGGMS